MASLLNSPILVSFKVAWALYFSWYTILYWFKPRHQSTYKRALAWTLASFARYITTVTFS